MTEGGLPYDAGHPGRSLSLAGDEHFEEERGVFVVPADLVISFVDPVTLKVVKNITEFNGTALIGPDGVSPRKWGDTVYAENPKRDRFYIFLNEMDVYTDSNGLAFSYINVIDTVQREIVARVQAGAKLFHGYAVFQKEEYWAHGDVDGTLSVISLDAAGDLAVEPVKLIEGEKGHTTLLLDPRLFPLAYATNVNRQGAVFEVNADTRTVVKTYDFASQLLNSSECLGTHTLAYSAVNSHLYMECVLGGGTLEWDVKTKTLVKQWDKVFGVIYSSHDIDSQYVIASDNHGSNVTVFQPQGPGEASTLITIPVGDNPGHPLFYQQIGDGTPDNTSSFAKHLTFFPLTNIVNKANIKAVAAMANAPPGGVTAAAYVAKPFDCKYNAATKASPGAGLMLATGKGATPTCGACASQDPATDFAPKLSGFRYIDLLADSQAGRRSSNATKAPLIPAGAIIPKAAVANATSNQCAYEGDRSRRGTVGSHYIAVFGDVPSSLLYVVDARLKPPKLVGSVPIGSNAPRVAWAPFRTYASGRTADKSIIGGGTTAVDGGPAPAIEVDLFGIPAAEPASEALPPEAEAPSQHAAPTVSRAAAAISSLAAVAATATVAVL